MYLIWSTGFLYWLWTTIQPSIPNTHGRHGQISYTTRVMKMSMVIVHVAAIGTVGVMVIRHTMLLRACEERETPWAACPPYTTLTSFPLTERNTWVLTQVGYSQHSLTPSSLWRETQGPGIPAKVIHGWAEVNCYCKKGWSQNGVANPPSTSSYYQAQVR